MGSKTRNIANNLNTSLGVDNDTITPATDLQPVKSDISALALREATNESSAAFNLPGQFIETFTDDTNLGTQTDCDRVDGYMATVVSSVAAYSSDSDTDILNHFDLTTLHESTGNHNPPTVSGAVRSSAQSKFGGFSALFDGTNDYLTFSDSSRWDYGTGDYTFETWIYLNSIAADYSILAAQQDDSNRYNWYLNNSGLNSGNPGLQIYAKSGGSVTANLQADYTWQINTWTHVAVSRSSGVVKMFVNGNEITLQQNTSPGGTMANGSGLLTIGRRPDSVTYFNGYMDEFRMGDTARYTSNFTPNTTTVSNPNGTLIQSANAVSGARTKVGGTLLYKDNAGTNNLGTEIKVYFTCDGGLNWTEASSYTAITPVYSTGIKQVRLGETTCTSGQDVRYKIEWESQGSGTKEAQIHGIGINY